MAGVKEDYASYEKKQKAEKFNKDTVAFLREKRQKELEMTKQALGPYVGGNNV